MRSVALRAALALSLVLLAGAAPARAGDPAAEAEIRAAFLLNLVKYVEWPSGAFASESDPIVVGVLASPRVARALGDLAARTAVGSRPVRVRSVPAAEAARGCHLLFIDDSRHGELTQIARELRGSATLTVAESERFARLGGVVGFELVGGKIRFEVNRLSAQRANLQISSRLLRLASAIH